jgi:hypothetical protein
MLDIAFLTFETTLHARLVHGVLRRPINAQTGTTGLTLHSVARFSEGLLEFYKIL